MYDAIGIGHIGAGELRRRYARRCDLRTLHRSGALRAGRLTANETQRTGSDALGSSRRIEGQSMTVTTLRVLGSTKYT